MERIEKLSDFEHLHELQIYGYLKQKAYHWMQEYGLHYLEDIGCFVILEESELDYLMNRMLEFVEVIQIENETYLHTVLLINDNFGEDIYLRVTRGVVHGNT